MEDMTLDDLLSLDPLLDTGLDSTPPVPAPAVSSTSESTGLPAGLKPTPADMVVRPAVVTQKKKENALDQLDTTLASLASSLGGSSSNWGTGAASRLQLLDLRKKKRKDMCITYRIESVINDKLRVGLTYPGVRVGIQQSIIQCEMDEACAFHSSSLEIFVFPS
ncbi:hypothetical protein ACTXT7_012132 [Hymenolepis weldensis]